MMAKTIDFQAVKESLAALDRIAAEHPELLGKSTPEEWEKTLNDQDTASTGSERQKRFKKNRLEAGIKRVLVWAKESDLETLRKRFPGPKGGVNWDGVINVALNKTRPESTP